MFLIKVSALAMLLIGVSSRHVYRETRPSFYIEDQANILQNDWEDSLYEPTEEHVQPVYLRRVARQAHGVMNSNPDGSLNINTKLPLAGNDKNILSAVGAISGAKNGGYGAAGGGLALDNVNGHGLSLTGSHIPNFGDQLTAAGKLNLVKTPDHNLNANAFVTRNMPSIPNLPNFNTHGGSLDYMYKDKIGGALGMSHTDLFKKTDYSAMGKFNLFKNPSSSLDLGAGFTKSVSPYIPNRSWEPAGTLTFSKYW